MVKRALTAGCLALFVAACDVPTTPAPRPDAPATPTPSSFDANRAARDFINVLQAVEPVAEEECRARTKGVNCDFKIVVDDTPGAPANAFQTVDRQGRPIIAFTVALIADARNADELAFVMGHEAAHHIKGHIARQQQNAVAGAVVSTGLAILLGGDKATVEAAQREGALVGSRIYSKDFELEADALGTVISKRAGYDPLKGAQFFFRIPDPGDRFLGTHPPNRKRLDIVRRTAAGL